MIEVDTIEKKYKLFVIIKNIIVIYICNFVCQLDCEVLSGNFKDIYIYIYIPIYGIFHMVQIRIEKFFLIGVKQTIL